MQTRLFAFVLVMQVIIASPSALAFETQTPAQVQQSVSSGYTILIDIRRPDEWAATGVASSAIPLDMRSGNFQSKVKELAAANPNKKIALICHSAVRSKWLASKLESNGMNNIVNVVGGMAGNSENPGWIAQGLPVRKP